MFNSPYTNSLVHMFFFFLIFHSSFMFLKEIFFLYVYGFLYSRSSPPFFFLILAYIPNSIPTIFFIYPSSLYLYSPYILSIYVSLQSLFSFPFSLTIPYFILITRAGLLEFFFFFCLRCKKGRRRSGASTV